MKILLTILCLTVSSLVAYAPTLPITQINNELANYVFVQAEQQGNHKLVLVFASPNPNIPIHFKRLIIDKVHAQDITIVP